MKFELNSYNHNISDKEFIEDIKKVARKLFKNTLTKKEYNENGRFSSDTIYRKFGSWKKALELAKLNTKGHNFKYIFSKDDVIKDINRVCTELKKDTLTAREYNIYGRYNSSTLMNNLDMSWNQILNMSKVKITLNRSFANEDLFSEIERIWIMLGRQPTTTDINKGISKYSLNTYARRFGGWRKSLQAFIKYINEEKSEKTKKQSKVRVEINKQKKTIFCHRTSRDINLRLRFKVLQRDHFKCCICGASPSKDPSVVLHIDHKKPWSKGGETVLDNLQTLCKKCNLGKSDITNK